MKYLVPFRDINVHASPSYYAFSSPSSPSAQTLVVDRPSGDLSLSDHSLLGTKRVSSIAGILGMIKLRLDKYIIVINKAQPMGRLRNHMIYKIIATEILPLRERALHDPDEDAYLHLLRTFLKTAPMYFSYSLDLTNSFQRQAESDPSLPLWKRTDGHFFWNKFVQGDVIELATGRFGGSGLRSGPQPGADPFILPVMFGMLRISNVHIRSIPITFALITRRSRHRAGTRYLTRGIDDRGHVANFNETEQIIILNDTPSPASYGGGINEKTNRDVQEAQVLSFVQIRGSVPAYWAEINTLHYTPNLQIRNIDATEGAARLHFDEQISKYGDIYMVNLVNQKGREDKIKRAYEQVVRGLISAPDETSQADPNSPEKVRILESSRPKQKYDRLHYVYFDFHNETKGLKWHRAQILLDQLFDPLTKGQYFRGIDMPADAQGRLEIRNKQIAVVRTNCMDCLDRTNVIQTMLARWTLTRQLIDLGILEPGRSSTDDPQFEHFFRNIWADNADVVSKTYSGSGALKTDFTRTGKRTRAGPFQDLNNSLARYIKNNFGDGHRQDALTFSWAPTFLLRQVDWPKLNTPRWALEGYQANLGRAVKDPLIGQFIYGHERGLSNVRVASLEEGKKRIQ